MAAVNERVMSATEFKAKCLDMMDQLAAGTLARVVVTKRGRAVAAMVAAEPAAAVDRSALFGCMRDWPSPVAADHDWEKPLFTDDELDGFLTETERQIEEVFEAGREAA